MNMYSRTRCSCHDSVYGTCSNRTYLDLTCEWLVDFRRKGTIIREGNSVATKIFNMEGSVRGMWASISTEQWVARPSSVGRSSRLCKSTFRSIVAVH